MQKWCSEFFKEMAFELSKISWDDSLYAVEINVSNKLI